MNAKRLKLDNWVIDLASGEVCDVENKMSEVYSDARIEPQGIRFLEVLAKKPNELVSKEDLLAEIWGDTVVTDDALSQCVSRVRKVLGDDPKQASIIATLPKRGYRLIASDIQWFNTEHPEHQRPPLLFAKTPESGLLSAGVKWLVSVAVLLMLVIHWLWSPDSDIKTIAINGKQIDSDNEALVARGDDYYAQVRRIDNEMAIELYQQALAIKPKSGAARAGMANALVQQVLRWPNRAGETELSFNGLQQAIKDGRTNTPDAKIKLQRALDYAQKAVELAPNDYRTHKALGLVLAARSQFADALVSYQKAVKLNPDAWDALINIADIFQNAGEQEQAITYFEMTFEAMSRVSSEQTVRVRPWRADLGAIIGEAYIESGKRNDAEVWFRHVLSFAPLNRRAIQGLVDLAKYNGDHSTANTLCAQYLQKAGEDLCTD